MTETKEIISPALSLYECLLEFGEQKSNPVLQVLGGAQPLSQHKYPPGDHLAFGSAGWRAFYHSHTSPGRHEREHGHFHLFAPVAETGERGGWTHVVALSMDAMGQPIRWFAVNRWVTDGRWLATEELLPILATQQFEATQPLLARWLTAMVKLFSAQIGSLLDARDRQLTRVNEPVSGADTLEQREIYLLAESPINLMAILQKSIDSSAGVNRFHR
jgi:hypothetical protein